MRGLLFWLGMGFISVIWRRLGMAEGLLCCCCLLLAALLLFGFFRTVLNEIEKEDRELCEAIQEEWT